MKTIGGKRIGLTRNEISKQSGIVSGSNLTSYLSALIMSGFVEKYLPFGAKRGEEKYKLTDSFCLFSLKFLFEKSISDEHFYEHSLQDAAMISWRGLAFENVCFQHIPEIKKALGISGVTTRQASWSIRESVTGKSGTQIDMLINRDDNVVNMCEIKYSTEEFAITKSYDLILRNRAALLSGQIPKRKAVHSILITTFGLRYNEYSGDFLKVITMEDLF